MLDQADPQERVRAAEALIRSGQAVQFDVSKPPETRTLPGGFLRALLDAKLFVLIDGAVFSGPCILDNIELGLPLILRNCSFSMLSATAATFRAPINLSGSAFESGSFNYASILEANLTGIRVSNGLSFAYAQVAGELILSDSTIAWLAVVGARVDGDVVANGATIAAIIAQGLTVKQSFMAVKAHFQATSFSDVRLGSLSIPGSVFDQLFQPVRAEVRGMVIADGAVFNAGLDVEGLGADAFSLANATITGNALFTDLDLGNFSLRGSTVGGALRFERGSVRGVFDVKGVTVTGDFVLGRTELKGGADLGSVEAATLQLLEVVCEDVYATYPNDADGPDGVASAFSRDSRFGSIAIERSQLAALRPSKWMVRDAFFIHGCTIGFCMIEETHAGTLRIQDSTVSEGCFLGSNVIEDAVHILNLTVTGPLVFLRNTIDRRIEIILSQFRRLDVSNQPLPKEFTCTSSTVTQLIFDDATRKRALTQEARERYTGRTIDLENSTYDQIICNVEQLERSLAPKDSRQQFVVFERALRQAGFDELADGVYRSGRTWYYRRVKPTDFYIWARGSIANWTTGYGLSVTRITMLTFAVPLIVFALLLLSPGSAVEGKSNSCTTRPGIGTAAVAVGTVYINDASNVSEVHLTDCPLVGVFPARGVVLPLRILGLILIPLWFAIATGILKYAVKTGD